MEDTITDGSKTIKLEETTTEDSGTGNKPEVYKPIDDANLAAKRLEDANKERRELLAKEEEMIAKRTLGGITEAGSAPVKKTKTDAAAEFFKDTQLGKDILKANE